MASCGPQQAATTTSMTGTTSSIQVPIPDSSSEVLLNNSTTTATTTRTCSSMHHHHRVMMVRVVSMAILIVAVSALTFAFTWSENEEWISSSLGLFGHNNKNSKTVLQQLDQQEPNANATTSSCKPLGIHLALGRSSNKNVDDDILLLRKNSTIMSTTVVSFYLPFLDCLEARPIVSYGSKGKERHPIQSLELEPSHISFTSRKTDNITILSDWVYHAELSGLVAGQNEYWYRIDVIPDALSEHPPAEPRKKKHSLFRASTKAPSRNRIVGEMHYFRTPPLLGTPTSFAIVADVGDTRISKLTIQGIEKASLPQATTGTYPVTLAIIAGDITYGDAEPWYWTKWFRHTEYLFQHLPLSVAAGNHEVEVSTIPCSVPQESGIDGWNHALTLTAFSHLFA